LRDWLSEEWRVYDAGRLPADEIAVIVPASATDRQREGEPGSRRTLLVDGHELVLDQTAGECTLEGVGGGCRFSLSSSLPVDVRFWGDRPQVAVYTALSEIFRAKGWLSIHASGVVWDELDAKAHLYLGRSGAGKSFQLLKSIAEGARPIGEDRIWLGAADLRVAARDDSIRIKDDGFAMFRWLDRHRATIDPDGKYRIRYRDLQVVPALPCFLAAYSILGAQKVWTPIEVAAVLWEAVGLPFTPESRSVVAAVVTQLIGRGQVETRQSESPPLADSSLG
jgi:hypothetical protein